MIQQLTRREVRKSVGAKCRELKASGRCVALEISARAVEPEEVDAVVEAYRKMRLREVNTYAQVQVVPVGKKFGLNYDRANPESITGPFPSAKQAREWFMRGGR
ncbi:hypothetical protein BAJUN_01160 [Bajunvirus bajun]|uniref:Uncharacterized protein n=1 Tax=Brevundimonas phage vB_BgoS-Bajun TaxID=2948594 RepID=A0A9E7N7M2_9CAUD|nr:hypothetical protein BAJUN_01160 [Brevundimonas phage vB_BgoS-Bajun]